MGKLSGIAGRSRAGRSRRGTARARGKAARRGWVLLDVLAALAIALVGLSLVIGGLSLAGRLTSAQAQRISRMLEQRNADAKAQVVTFPQ